MVTHQPQSVGNIESKLTFRCHLKTFLFTQCFEQSALNHITLKLVMLSILFAIVCIFILTGPIASLIINNNMQDNVYGAITEEHLREFTRFI